MEVYTKQELAPWLERIERLSQQVQELQQAQLDWVPLPEAMRLSGRSRAWFYLRRDRGTLPITMLPREAGNRRTMYSRTDCVAYGRENRTLPPAGL
ncbi:hypothetical protein F1C16_15655 [Hymenobacter sp. NBH84]|uniref:hypothetical protein n=1 Tax=Hymenobacter sp. NBH84 TaxID=2596915 RepID=UPI0016294152|nr:hypothetical protein [Hymenobacter sp. NBH84]QNE40896.1 hypothetical protein F1C16_15655 [Hymenobacter sp. NBH84]